MALKSYLKKGMKIETLNLNEHKDSPVLAFIKDPTFSEAMRNLG
jgi:hypothetical protein